MLGLEDTLRPFDEISFQGFHGISHPSINTFAADTETVM